MDVESVRTNSNISNINAQALAATQAKTEAAAAKQPHASAKSELNANNANVVKSLNYSKEENINEESRSDRLLETAVAEANKKLKSVNRSLHVSFHDETNRIMVKVVDMATDEVIREIPPEKTLDAFAKVLEMAGLLVDEKS